jgi:hypothetical protein
VTARLTRYEFGWNNFNGDAHAGLPLSPFTDQLTVSATLPAQVRASVSAPLRGWEQDVCLFLNMPSDASVWCWRGFPRRFACQFIRPHQKCANCSLAEFYLKRESLFRKSLLFAAFKFAAHG